MNVTGNRPYVIGDVTRATRADRSGEITRATFAYMTYPRNLRAIPYAIVTVGEKPLGTNKERCLNQTVLSEKEFV